MFIPFSREIKEDILVKSGRCCCVCHKFCGIKIEVHHVKPQADGGLDTFDNCIALCFDCHAEVESYNPKHPKGNRFTEKELKRHRDMWLDKIKNTDGLYEVDIQSREIDKKLYLRIVNKELPINTMRYLLHDLDLSNAIDDKYMKPMNRYFDSSLDISPNYEFLDSALEVSRKKYENVLKSFSNKLAMSVFPTNHIDIYRICFEDNIEIKRELINLKFPAALRRGVSLEIH